MRRRKFLGLVGSAAASWPLAARSQQANRVGQIGVLMVLSENDPVAQAQLAAFRKALEERGWTEGRNVRFEVRCAAGEIERVRKYAAELVLRAPDVILGNGTPVLAALKQATRSIPIVFVIVNDPVAQGLISSVAHPGGNVTGFSFMDYSVIEKTLQLLKQMAPSVTRIGFMFNPDDYPYYEVYLRSLQQQRQALSLDVTAMHVHSDAEIEAAITRLAAKPGGGLFAASSPFNAVHRQTIIEQTMQRRLPTVLDSREAVAEGGLMSYAATASRDVQSPSMCSSTISLPPCHEAIARRVPSIASEGRY